MARTLGTTANTNPGPKASPWEKVAKEGSSTEGRLYYRHEGASIPGEKGGIPTRGGREEEPNPENKEQKYKRIGMTEVWRGTMRRVQGGVSWIGAAQKRTDRQTRIGRTAKLRAKFQELKRRRLLEEDQPELGTGLGRTAAGGFFTENSSILQGDHGRRQNGSGTSTNAYMGRRRESPGWARKIGTRETLSLPTETQAIFSDGT